MTGGVITLLSCNPLSDARMSLLCVRVVRFRDNSRTLLWKFATWCLFYLLQVSFEQIFYAFAKKPDKLFWARLKEKFFACVGKKLEHLESREILCFHRPKVLTVSKGREYENSREWIRFLYNNVTDHLGLATNQSTKDQREQTLLLDTRQQLVPNQDPTVC